MLEPLVVILVVFLYMGLLFWVALWAERRLTHGARHFSNPLIYVLSLAVYCTTWTYYGSVGFAATTGGLFLTVYLGPTIMLLLFGAVLRKLVRLKNEHRITSIADFLGSRYGKSQVMAGLATLIALVGTTPYVALQLKAVISSFTILTGSPSDSLHADTITVIAMIFFAIAFGVRRLDPTERHQGIVMAVALQSLFKLVLFFVAGLFVVYSMNDGFMDLFSQVSQRQISLAAAPSAPLLTWTTWLVLSMAAVFLLPHQFHIAVVENLSERHIRSAAWMFPLYLVLITLFVYPIAMAGLLQGLPISQADFFVLKLPLLQNHLLLPLLVFLGGLSAAAGMIMIAAMTMATMTSNHLLLPLFSHINGLGFLRRHLLGCRWAAVAGFIFIGYWFERKVGESYMLVNIGMISFAAMFQFAPPVLMGIFWKKANKIGAILGLTAGFSVWAYTSLLPSFVRSGWLSADLLTRGPFGMAWLNPEQLFGFAFPDPLSHTVVWTLVVNGGLLIAGSLLFAQEKEESSQAEEFVTLQRGGVFIDRSIRQEAYIDLRSKELSIADLFGHYFESARADEMCRQSIADSGIVDKERISIVELAELCGRVETLLAGSIGSGAAREALKEAKLFTPREARELSELYSEILTNFRTSPEDLWRRINFYREREALIARHSSELEGKVKALEAEIVKRKTAEAQLRESEERYRTAIEHSNDGVGLIKEGRLLFVNHKFAEIFGYDRPEDLVGQPADIVVHPEDRTVITDIYERSLKGDPTASRYDFKGLKKDGQALYIAVSATRISYMGEDMTLAFLRDVTMRRQAEDEIRHLSRRLIDGIEEEHKRLAADLHDELGQALTGLHLGLGVLANSLAPGLEKERNMCANLIPLAEGLAEKIRNLSTELRPAMLDDLGLVPTLRWYIQEFRNRITGIDIDFEAVGIKGRLPARVEILFYRIAQEGLTNIAKHSQASHVSMRLTYSFPQVIFFIRDNGIGFKPAAAPFSQTGRGIGLIGMRERVAAVGGKIDIQSSPGKGAQIRVTVQVGSVDSIS